MKSLRVVAMATLVTLLSAAALSQTSTGHAFTSDEVKKVVPSEFFFRGQKAAAQMRNAVGFKTAEGKVTFAALVDTSGYATDVKQKYQGLFVSETKLNIGGSELAPGEYGFGFTDGRFVVLNVAAEDTINVPFQMDNDLKRPTPLQLVPDGSNYKLYAGRKWVELKVE